MIKQFIKFSTLSLMILMGFTACDDADSPVVLPKGDFEKGYFISNEGNFGSPNASVTFMDSELLQETNDVFQSVNSESLGDILQSITFNDDYAYLIVNNSNKVEVVNRYTFKSVATITDNIKAPRYALVENGKLYITNSGENSIAVFDANSFAFITTIVIDNTVEEIIEENDFLYIMNASFGFGNTISVVDPKTNTVIKTITVGEGLNSLAIEDGILYALHNTGITKINTGTNTIIGDIFFEDGLSNASNLEVENTFIYFVSGAKIFKYNKDVTSLANSELVDTQITDESWFLGYGFNVVNDKLFYTDVKGFTENSEVSIYDLDGKFLKTFKAGIGARHIYGSD